MQIHFFDEKFISTTKKNVDLFYFDEKLRSTSKKDVDPFYFDEKLRSTSKKDVDPFYLYIYIYIYKKSIQYMQISKSKKQIIVMIKESRTHFDHLN